MGCHFLLQGTFPTQGSSPRVLHWQVDSSPLSPLGSPDHVVTLSSGLRNWFPWRKPHFLPQQQQGSVSLSSRRLPLSFLPGKQVPIPVSLIADDTGVQHLFLCSLLFVYLPWRRIGSDALPVFT